MGATACNMTTIMTWPRHEGALCVSLCSNELLVGGMLGGLVSGVAVPETPDDLAPGAAEHADGVGAYAGSGPGALVDVVRPGSVVAACAGEGADGFARAVVAAPAEAGAFAFAGFNDDGCLAGVGCDGAAMEVAAGAVADLGEHRGCADCGWGVFEQRPEAVAIGVVVQRRADLVGQLRDTGDDWFQAGDGCESDPAPGSGCGHVGVSVDGCADPREQLARCLGSAVAVAGEEVVEPLLADAAGVVWRGVAFDERECDRPVDVREHDRCGRPEALQLCAQLVGARDAMGDEVLARAGERAQRRRGVIVWDQDTEAVIVGACELGEEERVGAVDLATGVTEPRAHHADLPGVDGAHQQTGVEQPLAQQPIGALDRDQYHTELEQPGAQRPEPALVVTGLATLDGPAVCVIDADRMHFASPINTGKLIVLHGSSDQRLFSVAGGGVCWWCLTDGGLRRNSPLLLGGLRRNVGRRWSHAGPLHGLANTALSRRLCAARKDDQ
jgi:hypothetical protein